MTRCPTCGQTIDAEAHPPGTADPRGGRRSPVDAAGWVPVARLTNLAEAGFAESSLAEAGIPSCLRQVDDFSAVDGSWSQVFVLQVPEQHADKAAEQLSAELVDSAPPASPECDAADLPLPSSGHAWWGPLALVLLFGGLIYLSFTGQFMPFRRPPRPSLGDILRTLEQPLATAPRGGPPRYQIRFDPARQAIVIDADRNGDDIYEQRREFHRDRRGNWFER